VSTPSSGLGGLSAVKLALMARRVRAEAERVLRADPIAIVGMGCRVPGGGDSPDRFWDLLRAGKDAIVEVPLDRWRADDWYDADPAAPGKAITKWAGFIDHIDTFDAAFFGILPREADRMDPQQRLLLEVAMEALDDAGLPQERLRGTRAGVFVAAYHDDYAHLQYNDLEDVDARTLTGILHSVLTNRVSHFLDLRGPSVSVDTACSSSLVATHLACQSLRSGETDLAIAGGVSVMVSPELMISLSKVGFMAPDGRSKTFDARADGFGRGEGCGVVVMKRLADAVSDGDRVLAVIRGSAVNQDGHSTLLAAPNGLAQRAMIAEAIGNAQIEPSRIGYVETHGTGTALGDPIEVEALASVVGQPAPGRGPCYLGAAKANVGHLEAAAGVTGLIKAVLVLRHEAIPRQVHFTRLNPHISLEGTRLAVPTELVPWRTADLPRCAGVSAFGVGGTNAHVVLEEAPRLPAVPPPPDVARILPLSAQGPEALEALVKEWVAFLPGSPSSVADLCHTAGVRRTHHDCRVAVVGRTREELGAGLAGLLRDEGALGASRRIAGPPRVGFVFSGQGPQWHAMGRELLAEEPVFRDALLAVDGLLRPLAGWSLLEELGRDEAGSRLDQTAFAQPALFGLQVSLAALWRSWGVEPAAVVGHSVGEIAALHVAGVLALPDAVRVVFHRARIMQQATGLGRMAQVALTEAEAAEVVQPFGGRLSVAAMNGPRSSVLSGETAALESALAGLAARGVQHRLLPVNYAFHSAQMTPFQDRLAAELAGLPRSAPSLAVYSTVAGALATDEPFDPAYFGRNVREPVRFAAAVGAMAADGHDVFLEIGPHPVLGGAIDECLDAGGHRARVLTSLRRGKLERVTMLQACAGLYAAGATPTWEAVQHGTGDVVSLPAYPWQRKRHWIRPRPAAAAAAEEPGVATGHLLLGRRVAAAGIDARIFEGRWTGEPAWLAEHRIFGRLLLPAAAVLGAFHAAGSDVLSSTPALTGFAMDRPLFLPEPGEGSARWQVVATPGATGTFELALYVAVPGPEGAEGTWQRIGGATASPASAPPAVPGAPDASTVALDPSGVYDRFASLGVEFGPSFRRLTGLRRTAGFAEAWIELPEGVDPAAGSLHPLLLDGALQLCSIAAGAAPGGEVPAAVALPVGCDRARMQPAAPGRVLARARVRSENEAGSLEADVVVEDGNGRWVAALEGVRFSRAHEGAFTAAAEADDSAYHVAWHRLPARLGGAALRTEGLWLVLTAPGGAGDELARALEAAGARCCRARAGAGFARTSERGWTYDPAVPGDLQRVVEEAGALRGAVHLAALEASPLGSGVAPSPGDEDLLGTGTLLHLVQALAGAPAGACPLWVVTRGSQVVTGAEPAEGLRPRAAGPWGLASVVAIEHPELQVRRVDLDPAEAAPAWQGLASEILEPDPERRSVALRGADRWVPRLERLELRARPPSELPPVALEVVRAGTIDGVEPRPRARLPLRPDEVRLRVLAAGLNFRDVLLALGMYPGTGVPLGAECAGVVTEAGGEAGLPVGSRVFGFAPGSLASEVAVPAAFLAPVPAGVTDEEAAGLPVAYLTAWYGLHRLAGLQAGQRVLVHAAAGGVGLAAVQLAQRAGAEVFATAGSPAKRTLLASLGVRHVMDSRSLAFAEEVRAATGGQGVDVVLNSLAGDFIRSSLDALAPGGCFLELGKRDILTPEAAARLRPDVRYRAFDLGAEALADRGLLRPMLDELVAALGRGELRPLPVAVYELGQVREALRFMAQARHVGKLVVRPRPSGPLVSGGATYWITGGLGGVGLETARWLVRSGARSLVLSGRRPPGPVAAEAVRELERQGATVLVFAADAADRPAMEGILREIRQGLPPLRGIVHAAGAVDDGALLRQSWDRCRAVLRGKAGGAFLLHELTRELPLDFFVLYSAAGVILGAPGQGAYPAANAELDALALARRRLGLPALSVAWGPWADVGMAADLARRGNDVLAARGLGTIGPELGFARLEQLLREDVPYAAVLPIRWARFLAQLPAGADRGFFGAVGGRTGSASAAPAAAPVAGLVSRLGALPAGQRRAALLAFLSERALQVVGLDAATQVDPTVPLKELGLDSLMSVELRNTLARAIGRSLPATLVFDYPTLEALGTHLAKLLGLDAGPGQQEPVAGPPPGADARDEIAQLSDAEAEAALLAELGEKGP
jgi:acyl transferase domain-containing protein/NADPH:quinone reductase-like Zn-dependent oxidoreductase